MRKFVSLTIAMYLLLAGGASAEGILHHRDCRLQVSKRISEKREFLEARNALLQRGYVLITDRSDIKLHRPSTRHPSYRLIEKAYTAGDDSSGSSVERRLLWEGQTEDFPYCQITCGATSLVRQTQYPLQSQYETRGPAQCSTQGQGSKLPQY